MILASSDVTIAVVGAIGIVFAASVPATLTFVSLRRGQNEIADRVGIPNGNGSLSEMNEKQLEHQVNHRDELARLADHVDVLTTHVDVLTTKFDQHLVDDQVAYEQIAQLNRVVNARADGLAATLEAQDEATKEQS